MHNHPFLANPRRPSCTCAGAHSGVHLALVAAVAVALAAAATGCSSDPTAPVTEAPPAGCTVAVKPSADDQTAVQTAFIEAAEGSTICMLAGTYSFTGELSIDTKSITLRGAGQAQTILDFKGQTLGANGLNVTGDSVTIEELSMKNTPGDGIRASDVMDIHFKNVSVIWDAKASKENGAYGFYPVGCDGVRIEGCTVDGARDAGIYVGQSKRILVADCEARGNVAGIEIENSSDAEVRDNSAHDNTGGILVFNLPNLPVQDGKHANVHDNLIEHNNLDNFGAAGTTVSMVPRGTGIMVLSADDNEFHKNTITDNDSLGVLILGYLPPLFEQPKDTKFNQYPQGNWFHDNTFSGNGTNPDDAVKLLVPLKPIPDVVWDGCEDPMADNTSGAFRNCMSNNGVVTYQNMDLCKTAPGGSNGDISKVTCEYKALPSQDP